MSDDTYERPDPVRVHLTGSDIPMSSPNNPPRRRRGLSLHTYILTAAEPVQQILPQSEYRCEAWVQSIDQDFTAYTSKADAQAGGSGGITIPAFNRAPYPLNAHDPVWAKGTIFPTTICVSAVTKGP